MSIKCPVCKENYEIKYREENGPIDYTDILHDCLCCRKCHTKDNLYYCHRCRECHEGTDMLMDMYYEECHICGKCTKWWIWKDEYPVCEMCK